jgi:hypothetical protein
LIVLEEPENRRIALIFQRFTNDGSSDVSFLTETTEYIVPAADSSQRLTVVSLADLA